MEYRRINVLTGWLTFAVALIVYIFTIEPTASFWDCGEFIACSYKLEVPHPPGAPLFLLIGRVFSMFAAGDTTQVAYWVSMVSVISSAFTILFLFWSITHLVQKVLKFNDDSANTEQTLLSMGAGVVGALACTFSDSFWFSAVEAEVYGMSSFFTAFVFWAILKWENKENAADANKWLILIAYMVGLSIGVHLLNLVTIPALALIVYFKKYENPTQWGIIGTLVASGAIILIVMIGIIPGLPSIAGTLEVFFVNSLGAPFGSGVIFFGALFLGAIIFGIFFSIKIQNVTLNTIMVSFAFVIIGYASYAIVPIRSSYNPPIDENDPDDIISFVSYLKREQYGSRPLFYGQYYTADAIGQKVTGKNYRREGDKYVVADEKMDYEYDPKHTTILPRMYSSQPNHKKRYMEITGLKPGEKPSFVDNIYYMISHQLGTMYMRYFLWNFSGRSSDIQMAPSVGLFGAFKKLPDTIANNKGRNIYFALPLILGILGLLYQLMYSQKYFWVTLLLFFLTGAALVLYLNSPPIEPRERDYIYAGSYYAFTIWIGFGVLFLFDLFKAVIKNPKAAVALAIVFSMTIPTVMAMENWDDHDRSDRYFSVDSAKNYLATCDKNAIIFTGGDNDTFPLWYVQEVEGFRTDVRVIVLSYFNTDWYIGQMMRDAYESKALPFSISIEQYKQGGKNDYLPLVEKYKEPINAKTYINLISKDAEGLKVPLSNGQFYNCVPSKQLFLDVDKEHVKALGILPEELEDKIVDRMIFNVKGRGIQKNTLAVLDLIVNGNWERPIYFNNTSLASMDINLKKYAIQEGIAFRLIPVENPDPQTSFVDTNEMYKNMMDDYYWRGLDNPNVYYSEDYRNFCLNHRSAFNTLAENLIRNGEYDKALKTIEKSLSVMPNESIPYDYFNIQQVTLLLTIDQMAPHLKDTLETKTSKVKMMADEITDIAAKENAEMLEYMLDNEINDQMEFQRRILSLNELARAYRSYGDKAKAKELEALFNKYYQRLQR